MSTRRARARHRTEDDEGHDNNERWLLTYSDMITLLMVLFIVLFAISQVDKRKFAELADGLAHQLGGQTQAKVVSGGAGILDGGRTTGQSGKLDADPVAVPQDPGLNQQQLTPEQKKEQEQQKRLQEARDQIASALKELGLQNSVRFTLANRSLVVSIVTDDVLFDTAKANLRPGGKRVLDAIIPALANLPNSISVEGHTDDRPITGGPFASNWELSATRASTVVRYLIDRGITPSRLSATGYADERPIVPNDTPEHRQLNRRVDLVVLASTESNATPSPNGDLATPSTSKGN